MDSATGLTGLPAGRKVLVSVAVHQGNRMTPREVLQKTRFFAEVMKPAELDRLAAKLQMRTFPRGVTIVRQGDLGASMFVLVDGKVTVSVHSRSGEERVATLGPGDIVGEMSLLTGARRYATVVASKQVTAVEIAKPALEEFLVGSSELIDRFAEMVEQRLAEVDNILYLDDRRSNVGLSRAEIVAWMTAFYAG
jgi:CRP-like cAMP-binding protein